MSPRILILPFAAAVIAGLVVYKVLQPPRNIDPNQIPTVMQQAPLFKLHDHRKPPQLMNLERILGRHRIVLVFFNAEETLESQPVLVWLREHADVLKSQGDKVFAISTSLPQTYRKMMETFAADPQSPPFYVLSDLTKAVFTQYGLVDAETKATRSGVFLIDRAGRLIGNRVHPLPLEDPITTLTEELLK